MFFIMLKRNSINVHSNTPHSSHCKFGACQKWEPAGRIGDFGNFLNGFAIKKPRIDRPEYWLGAICFEKLWNTAFCPRSVW